VNVRSLSPEGGGVLLPFRGNRDDGPEGSRSSDPARDAGSPTVVHLTGRRRKARPEADHKAGPEADRKAERDAGSGAGFDAEAGTDQRRRPSWRRVAVVLASAALVVGGATAAAQTGVMPLSTERPQPRPAVSAPPTSAGAENGNLPAAYGLCTAFDRAAERGDDVATAQAFRNLAHAAGGSSRVSAYCAPFDALDRGRAG
jgi:hypothetical protein